VGGESVEDVDDFRKALEGVDDGESVLVSVVRDSERESVLVKPGPIEGTSQRVGVLAESAFPEDGAFRQPARSADVGSRAKSDRRADETPPTAGATSGRAATHLPEAGPSAASADQYSTED
jgi:hypothetical protein